MITKIERLLVLNNNQNIADVISGLQKAMRNEVTSEDFETKSDEISYLEMFDAYDLDINPVEKFNSIFSFDHSDIKTFTSELVTKVTALLHSINTSDLYIISHWKHNLFGALKNNYPPLKKALKNTKKVLGTLNYEEAIMVSLEDLPLLIDTFFWLERCDASAPEYIFFADINDRFAFNFCKFGNIHFIEFENEIINSETLDKFNMYFVDECNEQLSNSNSIEGRTASY